MVSLIMVIWTAIENPELDPFIYINRCYGEDHKVFLRDISSSQTFKLHFIDFGDASDKVDLYTKFVSIAKLFSGLTQLLVTLLMGFNITEGVIYYKIFSQIKRYIKFNGQTVSIIAFSIRGAVQNITYFSFLVNTRKIW